MKAANRATIAALVAALSAGCAVVRPSAAPPTMYSLDAAAMQPTTPKVDGPTLVVNRPQAAAGFDSQRIVYLQRRQELQHFGQAQWIETPPRMLAPLLVGALKATGAFAAVVQAPTSAIGDLRLDSEIVRLQHEFPNGSSEVRFTLRTTLVATATRRILGAREFEAVVAAPSNDPYGGVLAAGRAVDQVLKELAAFCVEAAARR